jgi:hypothetical protein
MAPPNNFDFEAQVKNMFILDEDTNKTSFVVKKESSLINF